METMSVKAEFGWIKINEEKYSRDVVIHSNGKITKREKKKSKELKPFYGHTPLSEYELKFLKKEEFEVLYIGCGHTASLPITAKALEILTKYNTVILPTPEVIGKIEQEKKKFVAIIHVTC
jgi:hypothetical protein